MCTISLNLSNFDRKLIYELYTPFLQPLIKRYLEKVLDPNTNLIKKNILLASARDGIKRQSSFYDNVICWATVRLAGILGIIQYIKENNLDEPFPLRYSSHHPFKKLYRPVRHFAPSYVTTSIWSHWGMEYIKLLILLARYNPALLHDAKKHLQTYKNNIIKYGGYPELYDKKGRMLRSRIYKSVLHNSWVINYEQAKMLWNLTPRG